MWGRGKNDVKECLHLTTITTTWQHGMATKQTMEKSIGLGTTLAQEDIIQWGPVSKPV